MATCVICNVCDSPGSAADADEIGLVPCNVRRFRAERFTLWRCRGCGSLHCQEDADLARFYEDYPITRQRLDVHARTAFGNRLGMLRRHGFAASQRLLDYGCGSGLFLTFLNTRGISQTAGFDAFVAKYADGAALDETYDAVVSYDVIEHVDDPRAFMTAVSGLVRPGGLLVIGTPNADHLSVAQTANPGLHVPYHRHILSERALVALAAANGLAPEEISRRSAMESIVPTVNWRFVRGYIEATGGLIDASFEPPQSGVVMRSPRLLLAALFGSLAPARDNMIGVFRKPVGGRR